MSDAPVEDILLEINQNFYRIHAASFSSTRQRLQPGVRRLLESLPPGGRWLDLGCGNGALCAAWAARAVAAEGAAYLGLDFSPGLLQDARRRTAHLQAKVSIAFQEADFSADAWHAGLPAASFDVVSAFAALHHLPGRHRRLRLLQRVRALLAPGGRFVHSEWQFQHSPRLMARRLNWESVGLDSRLLEEGDTLLDWRHQVSPEQAGSALRYVHLFTRAELSALAAESGFAIEQEFESDGKEGCLALYQVWRPL